MKAGHDWVKCNCPEHSGHWVCSKCGFSSHYYGQPTAKLLVRKHLKTKRRPDLVMKGTGKPTSFSYFTCEEWTVEQVNER